MYLTRVTVYFITHIVFNLLDIKIIFFAHWIMATEIEIDEDATV